MMQSRLNQNRVVPMDAENEQLKHKVASKAPLAAPNARTFGNDISNRNVEIIDNNKKGLVAKPQANNLQSLRPRSSSIVQQEQPKPVEQKQPVQQQQPCYMDCKDDRMQACDVSLLELSEDDDFSLDAADAADAQCVTEYIKDIMKYMRDTENKRRPHPQYMQKQKEINVRMREILIDWLVEVHLKFKLRQETLYLTVNLIDRFCERRLVARDKLQLVGVTAMLLASKYEEIYPPEVRDFVYICDNAYTKEQILAMEGIMLNTLEFNLTTPSSLRFAERNLRVARGDETFEKMVLFYTESTLQDARFLNYPPSIIGAASTYLALKYLGRQWKKAMVVETTYTEADLAECAKDLVAVLNVDQPKYKAVRKKYSQRKYLEVAQYIPHM